MAKICVGPQGHHGTSEHDGGAPTITANLDKGVRRRQFRHSGTRRRNEEIGLLFGQPSLHFLHGLQNRHGQQPRRVPACSALGRAPDGAGVEHIVVAPVSDMLTQGMPVLTGHRMNPEHIVPRERRVQLGGGIRRPVLHELVIARTVADLIPQQRRYGGQHNLLDRPQIGAAENLLQHLVFTKERGEIAEGSGREHGGGPERPLHELAFAAGEVLQQRPPEVDLLPRACRWRHAGQRQLRLRSVAEQASLGMPCQRHAQAG